MPPHGDGEASQRMVIAISEALAISEERRRERDAAIASHDANESAVANIATVEKRDRASKITKVILTAVLGSSGLGGGFFFISHPTGETSAEEAVRRERIDVKLSETSRQAKAASDKVEALETTLVDHVANQEMENNAAKLRGVRQEMMLESILRRNGGRAPKMTRDQKATYRAVGIDVDDPLKKGAWSIGQD